MLRACTGFRVCNLRFRALGLGLKVLVEGLVEGFHS